MTPRIPRPFLATLAALLCYAASAAAENPWGFSSSFGSWSSHSPGVSASRIPRPPAARPAYDPRIHPAMLRAGRIADSRALSHSTAKCWRYVKTALLESGSVPSYPRTVYAKQAARELVENYGFVKLRVRTPSRAPFGSVLVYGGRGAGHVELRTASGFVSDYRARRPCGLPFIGAYARVAPSVQTAQTGIAATPGS